MSQKSPLPGEKHYTASIFLVTQDKPYRVLLVHHKKMNTWLPPGGHQEPHETSLDTAIRETKEETGIDITSYLPSPHKIDERVHNLPLPRFILEEKIEAHKDQPEHYHLDMMYAVSVPYQTPYIQEDESLGIGWFLEEEIDSLKTFENVAMTLKTLFQELKMKD